MLHAPIRRAGSRALVAFVVLALASALAVAVRVPAAHAGLPALRVVAPDGDDNGPGTDERPWRSLGPALQRLQPGTILLVKNGDYQGPFFVNVQATERAPVLVAAYPGHRPVLRTGEWQALGVHNSSYVYVQGFEVIGHAATGQGYDVGLEAVNSHHVRFTGNVVHDTSGGGIHGIHSNHLTIERNEIYGTSKWAPQQTSAISLWQMSNIGGPNNLDAFSNYIEGNYVHDNENRVGVRSDGNCIILDSNDDTGYTGATYITNNVCRSNGGRGIHVFRSANAVVVNNTTLDNGRSLGVQGAGELSAIYARNVIFRNNLVAPSQPGGGIALYEASNIITDHNVYVDGRAQPLGPGDRLAPGMPRLFGIIPGPDGPAADAGDGALAPAVDFVGRPRSGIPDAGAFEVR